MLAARTASAWFEVTRVDDAITQIVEPHVDAFIRCNIWHVRGRDRDLLIDSGLGLSPLRPILAEVSDCGKSPLASSSPAMRSTMASFSTTCPDQTAAPTPERWSGYGPSLYPSCTAVTATASDRSACWPSSMPICERLSCEPLPPP